jgi:hypothetical protein
MRAERAAFRAAACSEPQYRIRDHCVDALEELSREATSTGSAIEHVGGPACAHFEVRMTIEIRRIADDSERRKSSDQMLDAVKSWSLLGRVDLDTFRVEICRNRIDSDRCANWFP